MDLRAELCSYGGADRIRKLLTLFSGMNRREKGSVMRSRMMCLAVAIALSVGLWSGTARADLNNEVHNGVKGAVGLGLLGADITLMIEGAIGVRNPWLLSILPIVVAGGGAAGGYFMGLASAEASVATLVGGLALLIPAAILVARGLSYRPSRDADEGFVDRTDEGQPYEDESYDDYEEGETQTEVVGPEEGDSLPPNLEAPPSEEGTGPSASLEGDGPLTARVSLETGLPVGGMLRVVAEESGGGAALRLNLAYF